MNIRVVYLLKHKENNGFMSTKKSFSTSIVPFEKARIFYRKSDAAQTIKDQRYPEHWEIVKSTMTLEKLS